MIEKKKKKKKKSDFMLYLYLMMKSCKELNVMIVLATIYMIGERSPDEEEEEEDRNLGLRKIHPRQKYFYCFISMETCWKGFKLLRVNGPHNVGDPHNAGLGK